MKTKYLLEYIAEQSMQKQQLKPEMRHVLDTYTPIGKGELLRYDRLALNEFTFLYSFNRY
jgi:hypothetical protein